LELAQASSEIGKVDDLGILPKPLPFGKYYLLEKINTGGMAEVFKAKAFGAADFERILAVKRILPSIAEDEEFISMFIDEAKIAGQLNHANIAQIFDLGKVGEHYFIALEYIPGRDLRAIFDRAVKLGEKLSIAQVCYVTMKLCEGLDYAHNKRDAQGNELGIVHRDISPQNVLISYEGESKLIDFGIAKAHGKSSSTQVGILKGKFSYMSPEQVRGGKIDRRSDIFSLGIVLYELLTLERLFLGSSDFSTLEKIRKVEFSPPTLFNPHIPQELEDIVLKALARDPADRYQSAHEMQDALQKFMFNQGLYYTNKDLASYMKSAFATEISLEQKKLEYYRTLKKEDLDRANNRDGMAAGPASGEYNDLTWDDEESATNVFDRQENNKNSQSKEDILAELDDIELPEDDEIVFATPKNNDGNGGGSNEPEEPQEQFKAEPPPARKTGGMAPIGNDADVVPHAPDFDGGTKRSKAPLIIGLVIAILGLGAVAAWLLMRSDTAHGTVTFDIDPQVPVMIRIDGELITTDGPATPPVPIENVVANENHEYVVQAEGYGEVRGTFVVGADERRPVEITLSQTEQTVAAGGTGFSLSTDPPDAKVTVNGEEVGGSSPFSRTDLSPGPHELVISAPGYKSETRKINVPESTLVQLEAVKLVPSHMTLSLKSEPGSADYILTDKKTDKELRRGTTPDEIPDLPVDHEYAIEVSKKGYEKRVKMWTPPEGQIKDTELVILDAASSASGSSSSSSSSSSRRDTTRSARDRNMRDDDRKVVKTTKKRDDDKDDGGSSGGAAKAPGILKIAAKPPASVYINGKSYGKTPKKVDLPPGNYTIKLMVKDKGLETVKRVKLSSGKQLIVTHKW